MEKLRREEMSMTSSKPIFTLSNAVKKYEKLIAVNDVNLSLFRGECVAIVGESGSGKSTLGRLIVQLEKLDEGCISYDFSPISRRHIQIVLQDVKSAVDPLMTVEAYLKEPCSIFGHSIDIHQLLSKVDLQEISPKRRTAELSGGQRQRLSIARALSLQPKILVLDEPVAALDDNTKSVILSLLKDLKMQGTALVLITHHLIGLEEIADTIAVMYHGEIVEQGKTQEVFKNPFHPYTKSLLEACLSSDPRIEKAKVRISLPGEPLSPFKQVPGCPFAGRCSEKLPQCESSHPNLIQLQSRRVRCFLQSVS